MSRQLQRLLACVLSLWVISGAQAELLHRYSFTTGDTEAVDSVGGRNGTLADDAYISDNAVHLDGSDDYVNLPGDLIADCNNLTIEAWFTLTSAPTWSRLFDFGDINGSVGRYYLFFTPHSGSSTSRFTISDEDPGYGHEEALDYALLSLNIPVHIACVFDGNDINNKTMTLYVDGAYANSGSVSIPLSSVDNVYSFLGRSLYSGDPYLGAVIDEFRIYDHALSSEEVSVSYDYGPDVVSGSLIALSPSPQNNAVSVSILTQLSWTGPVETPDSYTVYVSEHSDLSDAQIISVTGSTTCDPDLEGGRTYYWRVDTNYGEETYTGLVWSFTTCAPPVEDFPAGDMNKDYEVSFTDLLMIAESWLDTSDYSTFAELAANWLRVDSPVVINEFMADNDEYLADPDGLADEYDDWIEIYNRSSAARDLGGMYLTDDLDTPDKWIIPDGVTVEPYDYVLFWADAQPEQGNMHTNFKLDADGEEIGLFDTDGVTLMDSVDFGQQFRNMSYGRYPDNASVWNLFAVPTPDACNCEGYEGIIEDVEFSVDGGIYSDSNEAFDVYLTCDTSDAVIRYTTDFTEPTETSIEYTGPIHIDSTTCLRAKAFKTGWYPPATVSRTYVFLDDVVNQSTYPDGFPTSWGSNVVDYQVDPDVVDDPAYSSTFKEDLQTIPSVCIVIPNDDFFGAATGLYANATQRGDEWEREASIEVIDPVTGRYYQGNAGLRAHGGVGRSSSVAKHSLRMIFRGIYGPSQMKFPLFPDTEIESFDQLVLRATWNYSWFGDSTAAGGLGTDHAQYMREVYSHDTIRDIGRLQGSARHVHVYVNGLYWGLYILTERPDEGFASEHLGGRKSDYDVIKTDATFWNGPDVIEVVSGDRQAWNQMFALAAEDLSDPNNYAAVQQYVDIPALIDYMLTVFHTGSRDAPTLLDTFRDPRNFYAIRKRQPEAGFVFLPWDMEWSLENSDRDVVNRAYENGYENPAYLFARLSANEEFRMLVADHIHALYFNNGPLSEANTIARYWNRSMDIDRAIIGESARWGDSIRSTPYTRDVEWVTERNRLITSFFPVRDEIVLSQLRTKGLYPNVDAPVFYVNDLSQYGGHITSSDVFSMTAPSGTIWYTTDGSEPRLPADDSQNDIELVLFEEMAPKKVWVPTEPLSGTGSISAEYWMEISGTSVSDLTSNVNYPDYPGSRGFLNSFEIPINWADNYGTRIQGYLIPPDSGDYTFWIASDDNSQLWLSTDDDPANVSLIASVNEWTNSREWTKFASQESDTISLTAGQRYYIEALQKEGTGGDNLAVSWEGPGFTQEVIEGAYLSPSVEIWTTPGFDDTAWTSGIGGVGYENSPGDPVNYSNLIDTDVKAEMYTVNPTCYIRIPFTISESDLNAINTLSINIRYDDGFIAYINGVKVAEDNADSQPAWNSSASDQRNDSLCVNVSTIDISSYIGSLVPGDNILSIHGMNRFDNSSDFLITAELKAARANPGALAPTAVEYTGPFTLGESTHIKARVLDGITWSALNEAIYAVGPVAENLRITEMMYHPADPNTEFIELQNIGTEPINPALVSFTNGIEFTFPSQVLNAGDYLLVAQSPAELAAAYPEIPVSVPVLGPYTGKLDDAGEKIKLVDAVGQTIHKFDYKDGWYDITDGDGFSLTIRDASAADPNLWDEKEGWRPSSAVGGSPGTDDAGALPDPGSVIINEVLAHSHATDPDWIELYNTTSQTINIGGWFLSDSNADDPNIMKYEFPLGTSIDGNDYVVFYEDETFNTPGAPGVHIPFALSEGGETLYLRSGYNGVIGGYEASEDFGASASNVAFGRYVKSVLDGGVNFVAMSGNTPGQENAYPMVGPIVISEIMYNPEPANSGGEYLELHNITGSPVTLEDLVSTETSPGNFTTETVQWRFSDGIDFDFPSNTTIPAHGYLIIAADPTAFTAYYGAMPAGVDVLGPFANGTALSNGGEQIQIDRPGDQEYGQSRYWIRTERVSYDDQAPWPDSADGNGDSLHQKTPDTAGANYGNDVINWEAGTPSPGL